MLSQTAEYALRAIVYLAGRDGKPVTAQNLAAAARVPADYLAKVLRVLGRTGIVLAQRGKRGGFSLARPAETLTILDVVNAVTPMPRIHTCPLRIRAHGAALCPLHKHIDAAMLMMEQAFGNTTIADIINEPCTSKPLCNIRCEVHA